MLYRSFGFRARIGGVDSEVTFTFPRPVNFDSPPLVRLSIGGEPAAHLVESLTYEELHPADVRAGPCPWDCPRLDTGIPVHLL